MGGNSEFWKLAEPASWVASLGSIQNIVVLISVLIGIFLLVPRYLAVRETARASSRAAEISAVGHAWERFTQSMENLRKDRMEIKVAAVLAIRNFLEQNHEGGWLVMETLENYVREVTSLSFQNYENEKTEPAAEVQAILTLLADQNTHVWGSKSENRFFPSMLKLTVLSNRKKTGKRWYLDLSNTDLRNVDLRGANLSNARLHNVLLCGANLHGANLVGSDLRNACLDGAVLSGADLSKANLLGASLRGASLVEANLSNTIMWDVDLSNAHLARSILTGAILGKAKFFNTQLKGADFNGSNLLGARFIKTNLEDAMFKLSEIIAADTVRNNRDDPL